ncbi:MAG: hypothetical protein JNM91_10520, partial [Flavobacteriales bacterium]|nr:hypothetical protein [Flavobacteriales bacterium]
MTSFRSVLLCSLLLTSAVRAQTTLFPGDLAIVGVNANNNCAPMPAQSDQFTIVLLKAITTNTVFFITDNGYERGFAGQWGDTEGVVRLQRTGAGLPAGSMVTVDVNGTTSAVTVTPAGWTVNLNHAGTGTFDLNSGGEQIFITQGGAWTNPVGNHNMTYNGTVLYGISTVAAPNDWVSLLNPTATNGSQRSGLPPGSLCFSMSPQAGSDFIKYIGPVGDPTFLIARTARQWLVDIDDNTRWTQYGTCALYNGSAPNYAGGAITWTVTASVPVAGRWTGAKTGDWFDCKNWDDANVPISSTPVVINPVFMYGAQMDCTVGINTGTPLSANCVSLTMTTGGAGRNLYIQNGRSLNVFGNVTITNNGVSAVHGITLTSGTLNAINMTLAGNGVFRGIFRNELAANTAILSGNLVINAGGALDLQGGGLGGVLQLAGNYTNNATAAAFEEVGSNVIFNGAGAQSITTLGGFAEDFGAIGLNKASGDVTLNSPINVRNVFTLTSGRLMTTPTNILTLLNGATFTGGSDASFIHGPMINVGPDIPIVQFPVGKGTRVHPLSVSNYTMVSTDAFYAEYFEQDPNTDIGTPIETPNLDHISSCEYWQLEQFAGTPVGKVTLGWKAPTSCGVTNLADLRVARWDGVMWRDRGNGGAAGTPAFGTIPTAAAQETDFTPGWWTLASATSSNPLPIELLSFQARPDGKEVRLDWSTATERDNDYFTVERSADGSQFEEVFRQPGAGNSASVLHYWGMDPWPLSGLSYYRLRQTDLDNTSTTSDVVSVRMARTTGEGLSLVQRGDELLAVHDLPVGSIVHVLDMTGRAVLVS